VQAPRALDRPNVLVVVHARLHGRQALLTARLTEQFYAARSKFITTRQEIAGTSNGLAGSD
jgi:hypothetical protein